MLFFTTREPSNVNTCFNIYHNHGGRHEGWKRPKFGHRIGSQGLVPIIHFLSQINSFLSLFSYQLGGHGWVSIIRFSLGINSYFTLLALKSIQGTEAVPLGQVLGHFRPPWGPRVSRLGSNYPFFICVQFLFYTFGSTIDPSARIWPWWPSFGCFRPPRRPRGSKSGAKWSLQLFITTWFYKTLL